MNLASTFEDRFCASKKRWDGRVSAWGAVHMATALASFPRGAVHMAAALAGCRLESPGRHWLEHFSLFDTNRHR